MPTLQILLVCLVKRKEPAKERTRHKQHQVKDGHSHCHQVIGALLQAACSCCPHNGYQDIEDQ